MQDRLADRRIEQLRRRVRDALALRRAAEVFLLGSLVAGAIWLLLRLLDLPSPPAVWLVAPLPVALGVGIWQARRRAPSRAALAAWLDRRLALDGLLVTGQQLELAEWDERLIGQLDAAPDVRPPLPLWAATARILPAAAFLALLAALPPAASASPPPVHSALSQQLERQTLRLEELREEALLPEPRVQGLEQRLQELHDRMDEPGGVHWADADALDAELERSHRLAADALAGARDALDAYSAQSGEAPDAAAAQAALDNLLKRFGDERLPALPADLAARLDLASAAPTARELVEALARSGADAATLAREVADALDGKLQSLAQSGLASASDARRLAAVGRLEREAAALHVHTGACRAGACAGGDGLGTSGAPGNGGVSRGRGDAELLYAGDTADSAVELAPEQLPASGQMAPEWMVSGVQVVEPVANPVEDMSPGGAGGAGAGEGAWHRRLAPRHRAAVERFFGPPK